MTLCQWAWLWGCQQLVRLGLLLCFLKKIRRKLCYYFAHAKNDEEHIHEQKSYPTQLKRRLKTLISNVFHCDGWGCIGILSMSMHEVGRSMANIFKDDKSYLTKWMWQFTNAIQHSLSWSCIKFSPFPSLIPWHPLPKFLFFFAYVFSRKVKIIPWHPLPNFLFILPI